MLYLVEFEATEAGAPMTRDQAIELLDKLVIPTLEKLAKDGRIRAGGLLVGARAGAFVVAAKSHDEVTVFIRALPAWGVWNLNVTPLESFAHPADGPDGRRTGNRSASVLGIVREFGFRSYYHLEGGGKRWLEEGLPAVR